MRVERGRVQAPPLSPTFVRKSSQTTAIWKGWGNEEESSPPGALRGRSKKKGKAQEHVPFWVMSAWHRLEDRASWQKRRTDWAVFISPALDQKARFQGASPAALQRSGRLMVSSTSRVTGQHQACDSHKQPFFPPCTWFLGRSSREYSAVIGCEAPTALASQLFIGSFFDMRYSAPRVSESCSGNRVLPHNGINCA